MMMQEGTVERSWSLDNVVFYAFIAITTIYVTNVDANNIFNTVPTTSYVLMGGNTAAFRCGTNDANYTLSFVIPGDIPLVASTLEYLPGGGTLATIRFKVTADNNGTSVRCIADDGSSPQITAPAFAYVYDDVPHTITSLKVMVERANCSLSISWSRWNLPFISSEIVVYNVKINGITDDVFNTTDTSFTYVPTKYGSHDVTTVAVTPIAGSLVGESATVDTSSIIPQFKNDSIPSFEVNILKRISTSIAANHSNWTYPIDLNNTHICPFISSNLVVICSSGVDYSSSSVHIQQKENDIQIVSVLKLPDSQKYSTCAHIDYHNGSDIPIHTYSTTYFNTSTYDLQNIQPFTSNGKICLSFTRVNGSLTNHVHMILKLKSSEIVTRKYNFSDEQLVGTECYGDIRETILTLEAYDGLDSIGSPAVVLYNIEVPKPLYGSSLVVPTTSKTESMEPSVSNVIGTARNHVISITLAASLGIFIILLMLCIITTVLYMLTKYKKFKKKRPENTMGVNYCVREAPVCA